jgi:superfamily II DNA or RNA helicase
LNPKWRGTVSLPAIPARKSKLGDTTVYQIVFRGGTYNATIWESDKKGHDEIKIESSSIFRSILLRQPNARRISSELPVVVGADLVASDSAHANLDWDSLGFLETYADTPDKVLATWASAFTFRTEDEQADVRGLRPPQIGALHAISAHFAVGQVFEPATIVLPTGTGKTETMLAAQVYLRLKRSLVVVPSLQLRSQIARKFISLGVLPSVGVIPSDLVGPRVAVITTGIRTIDNANAIADSANVIITLPNTLRASDEQAASAIESMCTDLMVDEAHHVTAQTWAGIKASFVDKRIVQFTATPFRRDEKRVDGKIIFNYKLGDAQQAGYYRQINLITVEDYGDEDARDTTIAKSAVAALRRDLADGFDHVLMARTRTKERAQSVYEIYAELAGDLSPVLVYSGPGRKGANDRALDDLHLRATTHTRIVVCVDMLGEGFDLPNLKIAALHDAHRSLAIALQFIGRFTRNGITGTVGEATVVANIADHEMEKDLADLYAEGADWDHIIKRLSEERIEEELLLQKIVDALKQRGNLHSHLSLWNLRPSLSAQFYRTSCDTWNPERYKSALPRNTSTWYSVSDDSNLLVAVSCAEREIGWGKFDALFDIVYDLIIIRWHEDTKSLRLYASDYDGVNAEVMAKAVTDSRTELICGPAIFNILNNVELPLVKSLGSSRIGAISFTSYFGPNVTDGLALIEKAQSELNNIACLGYENGDRVVWGGAARRGKVWQQRHGSLNEWIAWTDQAYRKVSTQNEDAANIVRDFLRPVRLGQPHSSAPIAVQWGEQAQTRFADRQFVVANDQQVPIYLVSLNLASVEADGSINIEIATDHGTSTYRLVISDRIDAGYRYEHIDGDGVRFQKARNAEPVPIEQYLQIDPLIIRYADGTYSYNCFHIPIRLEAAEFPVDRIEAWDWADVPLNSESMHKDANRMTIQYRTMEVLKDEYDLIFNDDGCGEAADLVCLKDVSETAIRLCLVHCKGAHGGRISADIRNFYVVCGQAQKSIAVKHAGMQSLYLDLKRREDLWARDGATRFLKGGIKLLSYFKEKARRAKVEFEVILVQPGASLATISRDARVLLATTEAFLMKTTEAKFRVAISA